MIDLERKHQGKQNSLFYRLHSVALPIRCPCDGTFLEFQNLEFETGPGLSLIVTLETCDVGNVKCDWKSALFNAMQWSPFISYCLYIKYVHIAANLL